MAEDQRLSALERAILQLGQQTERSLQLLSREMISFKEEMRAFKNEMLLFKNETLRFQQESELDRKRMNRAWGELANKLGTILEDIAAPNVIRIAAEEFGFAVDDLFVRAKRASRSGAQRQSEFDVICAGPNKVIYAEMKSAPGMESLTRLRLKLQEFFDFFPEYLGRELIGIYASWSLDEKMRAAISEAGLYGVAMGEETMEIVARPSS